MLSSPHWLKPPRRTHPCFLLAAFPAWLLGLSLGVPGVGAWRVGRVEWSLRHLGVSNWRP